MQQTQGTLIVINIHTRYYTTQVFDANNCEYTNTKCIFGPPNTRNAYTHADEPHKRGTSHKTAESGNTIDACTYCMAARRYAKRIMRLTSKQDYCMQNFT